MTEQDPSDRTPPAPKQGGRKGASSLLRRLTGLLRPGTAALRPGRSAGGQATGPATRARVSGPLRVQGTLPLRRPAAPPRDETTLASRTGSLEADRAAPAAVPPPQAPLMIEEPPQAPLILPASLEPPAESFAPGSWIPEDWVVAGPAPDGEAAPPVEEGPAPAESGEPGAWLVEMRSGTQPESGARQESGAKPALGEPTVDRPVERRAGETGSLISMITGILRPEQRRESTQFEELSDEMVTGRLERSLGHLGEAPSAPTGAFLPAQRDPADTLTAPNLPGALEESADELPTVISPEDEALLWGEAPARETASPGPTFTPQDVWGDGSQSVEGGAPRAPQAPPVDLYAAVFLTGQPPAQEAQSSTPQSQLLRAALENSPEKPEPVSVEDLRAAALGSTDTPGPKRPAPAPGPSAPPARPAGSAEAEARAAARAAAAASAQAGILHDMLEEKGSGRGTLARYWLSLRSPIEKVLLVELLLVALALALAIPFFTYLTIRGLVGDAAEKPVAPASAEPVLMRLPGGWEYPLQPGQPMDGEWQPEQPQWMQPGENRYAVALPWTPDTEAVFRALRPGARVQLEMRQGAPYECPIVAVDRLQGSVEQILADRQPPLLLILAHQGLPERWAVTCGP